MIASDHALDLIQLCRPYQVATAPTAWELCPGSPLLTLQVYVRDMDIPFPVGIRYGWDLGTELHLHILKEVYYYSLQSFTWASMPCQYWTQAVDHRPPLVTASH